MPDTPFMPVVPAKKTSNIWMNISLGLVVLVLLLGGVMALLISHPSLLGVKATTSGNSTSGPVGVNPTPVATTAPGQPTTAPQPTPTPAANVTVTPTLPPITGNDYSAVQPGPGCDSGGGTWAPQGPISNISCGTTITVNTDQGRGYLDLQLPANKAFSTDNRIGITSTLGYDGYSDIRNCGGLAEQDANSGFLVEYCNNGAWFIYSISGTGAIVQTLDHSITSTRHTEALSLSLKGTTLTFIIDTEVHTLTISPLQPTKVAITYYTTYANNSINVANFSYITPSN